MSQATENDDQNAPEQYDNSDSNLEGRTDEDTTEYAHDSAGEEPTFVPTEEIKEVTG